jgi:hypothetical protein
MDKTYINNQDNKFYFDADMFVQNVLIATGMDKASIETIDKISFEIKATLSERIMEVVINSFSDRELFLLNKLIEDHPQIDEIDALSLIVPTVPGLADLIVKTVDDLFDELVQDFIAIEYQLKAKS